MNIRPENIWHQVKTKDWPAHPGMRREIDFGFDREIPEDDRERFRTFVAWAEEHFVFPVTLWIDFKYRHYLLNRSKQRMGYLLYTARDVNPQDVTDMDDIPVAEIPVRREQWRFRGIMYSLIECITDYYLWLLGHGDDDVNDYAKDVEEILTLYQEHLGESDAYWN